MKRRSTQDPLQKQMSPEYINNCILCIIEHSCYLFIVWRKSYDPFFSLNFSPYHLYHLLQNTLVQPPHLNTKSELTNFDRDVYFSLLANVLRFICYRRSWECVSTNTPISSEACVRSILNLELSSGRAAIVLQRFSTLL